ncbi:MAG TPA: CotH kinase family protein [Bacteroidales bacterium]|nr:CotH kinase family protein [Bacteroidales bacterium]
MMKKLVALLMIMSSMSMAFLRGQTINHWETAVFNTDTWHYFVGTSEPDANWRSLSFDDSSWPTGIGGFGYSDDDDNTVIPQTSSVYIRIKFTVTDTAVIGEAVFNMDYDDSFIAYLNDVEIARAGLTGIHPPHDQYGTNHEATMYSGGFPSTFILDKKMLDSCLLPGENVLAIQVHNATSTSSDMSASAWLSFGIENSSYYFRPVPAWFTAPVNFTSSNLPIVIINTDGGASIPDEPRIMADMKIIDRGDGMRNYLTDKDSARFLNYDGRIDIEIRGSSSQSDPKKQYGFSTKEADGLTNNNVKLMGLPKDNDWILNGLVFETSLMRNYICYNLSRMIGEYASRTVYCEVVINGEYEGLYLLLEKVKQGHDRVNVIKIEPTDDSYPDVTGGYITKADKTTGGDPVAWTMPSGQGVEEVAFIHELPKPEDVTQLQNNYIRSRFDMLSVSAAAGNTSVTDGFPSVIDIPSFIDYMIINELSANVDAYQYSTYFHKDRNGKLRAGPIWDQDLTFGYDLFFWGLDRSKTDTWQFNNGDNEGPLFWKNLFFNAKFKCYMAKRWKQLTGAGQALNPVVIDSLIDSGDSTISEAVVRENARWGTSLYHEDEVQKIKTFIRQRETWMTSNLGSCDACSNDYVPKLVIDKIMYFPDSTLTYPSSKDQEFIEITNAGEHAADLTGLYFSGTGFVYQFPAGTFLEKGSSLIIASKSPVFLAKYGIHPFGQYTRNLSNSGESLVLVDAFGNVVDSVVYSAKAPWPDASANGYYLELPDLNSDNSQAINWIASNNTIMAVNDVDTDEEINLYPLPARDILHIEAGGTIRSVQLISLQGNVLSVINVDAGRYDMDLSRFAPGMYLVKVLTVKGSFVKKIIRQ